MVISFFKSGSRTNIPQQIYGTLVTQARSPEFFADLGVPDTVIGRFDVLAMHVYLFTRRLKDETSELAASLSQDVFDLFTADIERALRQLGIGDTTVPKRKKRMVHSFYATIEEFDPPLNAGDKELLADRVKARYFADGKNGREIRLADYILQMSKHLEKQDFNEIVKGNMTWIALK